MSVSGLLLSHAAVLVAWVFFVRREVRVNAALIAADGAANTLHRGFHQRRSSLRAMAAAGLALAGSLPLVGQWPAAGLSVVALLLLLGAYFVRTFNPALNRARGLDYVARFYLSPDPAAAAFPDQYIWRRVVARNPGRPPATLQYVANEANKRYLNRFFFVCLAGYGTLLLALHWLG